MENAIVQKLKTLLESGVDSEVKVVYFLAELRKLFLNYSAQPFPFALRLYTNWGLHVNLSHDRTTHEFLELVDGYVASVLAGSKDIRLENRMLRDFVHLNTFRQQLATFLNDKGLPRALCDEDSRWHEFLKHYAGVIDDGSLFCEGHGLKFVERLVFTKGVVRSDNHFIPFDLVWDIALKQKQKGMGTLTVTVNESRLPNGEPMTSSHIHLH